MIKAHAQPFCRCCGKPIRKATVMVYVEKEPTDYHRDSSYSRHIYGTLHTKAECQHRSNKQVLSLTYTHPNDYNSMDIAEVRRFTEWDGESYEGDGLFCGVTCAAEFGRGVARTTNYATQAWRDAMGKPARRKA